MGELAGKAGYESLWATNVRFEFGSYVFNEGPRTWVNDLLMAVFFFVVGMEIKRELVVGEPATVEPSPCRRWQHSAGWSSRP